MMVYRNFSCRCLHLLIRSRHVPLPTGLYTILYPRTGDGEGSHETLNRVYHSSEIYMF